MRVKHFFPIAILFFIGFYACNSSNGYKKAKNGIEYKFITEGKGDLTLKAGQLAEIELKYFSPSDSLIYDTKTIRNKFILEIPKTTSHLGGCYEDALRMMKEGDSAQFLIRADSFYLKTRKSKFPISLRPNDKLRFDIKIVRLLTLEIIEKEQKEYDIKKSKEDEKNLSKYLKKNNISQLPEKSGLIIIPIQKGKGKKIKAGQTAVVHYTGTLLNGVEFDSSVGKEPFSFVLGQRNVIKAWEEAVATMCVGDKIKIIAPYSLAYNERGAGKLIPPFSTLVFEIELLEIKK
jgi:FKBP-type peptidyl-prolyl cis-trans isomerase